MVVTVSDAADAPNVGSSSSTVRRQPEQLCDLWDSRFASVFGQQPTISILRGDNPRMPLHQTASPADIVGLHRVQHIIDLNRKKCAPFAQVMQSPPGWRCPETAIPGVDVRACRAKECDELPMGVECREVQGRCSVLVAGVHESRISRKHHLCA